MVYLGLTEILPYSAKLIKIFDIYFFKNPWYTINGPGTIEQEQADPGKGKARSTVGRGCIFGIVSSISRDFIIILWTYGHRLENLGLYCIVKIKKDLALIQFSKFKV